MELLKNKTVANAQRNPVRLGQFRNLKIGVSEDIRLVYLDEDENFIFKEFVLEELDATENETTQQRGSPDHGPSQAKNRFENLANVEKNFAISKSSRQRLRQRKPKS